MIAYADYYETLHEGSIEVIDKLLKVFEVWDVEDKITAVSLASVIKAAIDVGHDMAIIQLTVLVRAFEIAKGEPIEFDESIPNGRPS